jgi:hypothetical protein
LSRDLCEQVTGERCRRDYLRDGAPQFAVDE